jgi:hypothetical protein
MADPVDRLRIDPNAGGSDGELALRCTCGALRGVARGVSGATGNRVVCYCDDCQLFAHFLGRPDEILDERGGTDVFQMSPALLRIAEGVQKLACMRLTPTGIVRWYADCCRTPIGNTLATANVPFVGLIHACIDRRAERALDAVLGPVRFRIFGRFAKAGIEGPTVKQGISVAAMLRFGRMLLRWRWRGDHARSPFFDARGGRPVATPYVLGAEELERLRAARGRWLAPS